MSTAGAVGFQVNGEYKIAHIHEDCYPSGVGADIAALVARTAPEKLRTVANVVKMVTRDSPEPTESQMEHCVPWTNAWVGSHSRNDWHCLTRMAQGNLQAYVEGLEYMFGHPENTYAFAFIWNSDANLFEYYRNFCAVKRRDVAPTHTAAGTLLYEHGELMATLTYEALRALVGRGLAQDYFEELDWLAQGHDVLTKPDLDNHNQHINARLRELIEVAQSKTVKLTEGDARSENAPTSGGTPSDVPAVEAKHPSEKELLASLLASFDGDEIVLTPTLLQQLRRAKGALAHP